MGTNVTPQEDNSLSLRHWSMYGQPGDPPTKRVMASDWKTKPFAQEPITSAWKVDIKASDLSTLLNGFRPREMEDKWFIYADEPDSSGQARLHFFRSWTGMKMAEVILQTREVDRDGTKGESAQITGIVWKSSDEGTRLETEAGVKEMVREVCRWVLNVELPEDQSDSGVN